MRKFVSKKIIRIDLTILNLYVFHKLTSAFKKIYLKSYYLRFERNFQCSPMLLYFLQNKKYNVYFCSLVIML